VRFASGLDTTHAFLVECLFATRPLELTISSLLSFVSLADLCEAEFEKLGEAEKRCYIAICWPGDDSDGSGSDD